MADRRQVSLSLLFNTHVPISILPSQRLKHLKQKYWETKGNTMMVPASLHYSNVNLIDPTSGLTTRVGTGALELRVKLKP